MLELERENQHLRKTLDEITCFLGDYGLRWVGGAKGENGRVESAHVESAGIPPMQQIRKRVDELNAIAGDGSSMVPSLQHRGGRVIASLDPVKPLALTFWRDGLQVGDQPVRAYADAECAAFIADLLDGYFPYEMRHAFPDGCAFELRDRTEQDELAQRGAHNWGIGHPLAHTCGGSSGANVGLPVDSRSEAPAPPAAAMHSSASALGSSDASASAVLVQVRGPDGLLAGQLRLPAHATLGALRAEVVRAGLVRSAAQLRELELSLSVRTGQSSADLRAPDAHAQAAPHQRVGPQVPNAPRPDQVELSSGSLHRRCVSASRNPPSLATALSAVDGPLFRFPT